MKIEAMVFGAAMVASGVAWAQDEVVPIGDPIATDGPAAWTVALDAAFDGGLRLGDDAILDRLYVSPRGFATLGAALDDDVAPRPLADLGGVHMIAPFWDALDPGCSAEGAVNALVEDGAVTIQWFEVSPAGCAPDATPITFDFRLEQLPDGGLEVELRYADMGATGAFAPRAGAVLGEALELFPDHGAVPPPPDRAKALADGSSDGERGVWTIEFDRGGNVVGDRDLDGVRSVDNCDRIFNPRQLNLDGDALGDACDADIDGDDVFDWEPDNCPWVVNPGQKDSDGDGLGDICDDSDGDLIADALDGCPLRPNTDQADLDRDGTPDACDDDIDGDNAPRSTRDRVMSPRGPDVCQYVYDFWHFDTDGDSIGDACDLRPLNRCKGIGCQLELDADGDGFANAEDVCPYAADPLQQDGDGDGVGDACDPDLDDDGIPDIYAAAGLTCSPLICSP